MIDGGDGFEAGDASRRNSEIKRLLKFFEFSSCPWITRVIRQSPAILPGRRAIYTAGQPRVKAREAENEGKSKKAKGKSEEAQLLLTFAFLLSPSFYAADALTRGCPAV